MPNKNLSWYRKIRFNHMLMYSSNVHPILIGKMSDQRIEVTYSSDTILYKFNKVVTWNDSARRLKQVAAKRIFRISWFFERDTIKTFIENIFPEKE